jgi:hypothetical protein
VIKPKQIQLANRFERVKVWSELELMPEEYISLISDMVSWLTDVWNGKLPSEKPKLCQYMENNCGVCIKYLHLGNPCYETIWDEKGKCVAKEHGWKILGINGKYHTDQLPNRAKAQHKFVFEGMIKYYTGIIKSIKNNYIENLIEVKLSNNEFTIKDRIAIPNDIEDIFNLQIEEKDKVHFVNTKQGVDEDYDAFDEPE